MIMQKILICMMLVFIQLFSFSAIALDTGADATDEVVRNIAETKKSDLFGSWLFEGGFQSASFSGVNPDYRIAQGDTLLIQLWGGIDYQNATPVDAQGNIFIPKVGPIKVQGIKNSELNNVILRAIKRVYKANVSAYVTLQSTQLVKVFLSGQVEKPGLYEGQSADSVLRFIDQAGGIREDLGGYRRILVKRNGNVISNIDLYKFINRGEIPFTQLQDGDVIFVSPMQGTVTVEGEVGFEGRYELAGGSDSLQEVLNSVAMKHTATHITLVETKGTTLDARQIPVAQSVQEIVKQGAVIKVSSQLRATNISVEVLGEHNSELQLVLPWGASLKDALDKVEYSRFSNQQAIQLFRSSVAERQKEMLLSSLDNLERNVLATPSSTNEAAQLRQTEAKTVLQWIERARLVEPKGQVLLTKGYDPANIILKQGDRIVIPSQKSLVIIHGNVLFPSAIAYKEDMTAIDYIAQSGGVNGDIDDMRILLKKPNGSFVDIEDEIDEDKVITNGDEVFVLPEPDIKSLQVTKDISQVIYQVALSAAVVLAL